MKHGTNAGYRAGCREECCRAAHRTQMTAWRRRRVEASDLAHGTYAAYNVGCRCESCRQANRLHAAKYRAQGILHGVTREQWDAWFAAGCAICSTAFVIETDAQVDHDHAHCHGQKGCPECVRGLLCGPCNRGLAGFRDDPAMMRLAAVYIEERR